MITRSRSILGAVALAGLIVACSDVSAPTNRPAPGHASFAGRTGTVDTGVAVGGGGGGGGGAVGGGGGGGGGGGATAVACGKLSAVNTYQTVLYTTRVGIGFTGNATNCSASGGGGKLLQIDVVDQDTGACAVAVPHFLSLKNTATGSTIIWTATSTLVNCQGITHWFTVTLSDANTGAVLDSQLISAFL